MGKEWKQREQLESCYSGLGGDSGLHWDSNSGDEEKWMEFKIYLKVEPTRLVGRLDEMGKENRVIKDDSIFGLNNWTDNGTID